MKTLADLKAVDGHEGYYWVLYKGSHPTEILYWDGGFTPKPAAEIIAVLGPLQAPYNEEFLGEK